MLHYILNRLLLAIPTLIGVTLLVFVAIRLVPGDSITAMLGTEAGLLTETQRQSLEAYFGLDKSPAAQYFSWLGNVLRGDLGFSVRLGEPVGDLILKRFPGHPRTRDSVSDHRPDDRGHARCQFGDLP